MQTEQKVILITGSGHGIGRASARLLASQGHTVAINDLKQEFVDEAIAQVRADGGDAIPVVANVASRDGVRAAVQAVLQAAGRLDVMVNNAAWVRYQAIPDIAPETLERMVNVGFSSYIWGIQAAAEAMDDARGGAIVNVASAAAFRSAPNSLVYSAIKAGVGGMTRAAAAELGARNIRVNAVAPSAIPTEGTQRNRSAERDAMRVARTPLGRLGTVEDIAHAVAYFATDASRFVTGQVLLVDGGINTANL